MTTDSNRAHPVTIRELVDRNAERLAELTFLVCPETRRRISYREFRELAVAAAKLMSWRGVGQGDRVCLAMDNGVPMVAYLFGAMYAGFVPVPLPHRAGPFQIAHVLRHARIGLAVRDYGPGVTVDPVANSIGHSMKLIEADQIWRAREEPPPVALSDDVEPEADALVLYTSGSTELPKGVLRTQRAFVWAAHDAARTHELGALDRLLCVMPLYHNSALNHLAAVMASGGSVVLPTRFHVARYWRMVADHRCSWLALVPTMLAELVERSAEGGRREHVELAGSAPVLSTPAPRGVRFARCSTAALADELHREFERRFDIPLVQGMGMTEAGGVFLNPPSLARRKIGSIGVPGGMQARIVDEHGNEVGIGEIGEIRVRGPGLMKGYLGDAAATVAAFDAQGWLRSGDLGFRDQDGYFFHAGRKKELIVKGGTNLSPREIEAALERHPEVAAAAVVGVPDPFFGEDIVAFAVPRPGARLEPAELYAHAGREVGVFKTPRSIVLLEELPRRGTGKVDKPALERRAARLPATADVGKEAAVPLTELDQTVLERELSELWSRLLSKPDLRRDDDFFASGGTSIEALQMLAELRKRFGERLAFGDFFAAPSVAGQAALLLSRLQSRSDDASVREVRGASVIPLACEPGAAAGVPLFCVSNPQRYRWLARELGAARPVHAVFPHGDEPEENRRGFAPGRDVIALARDSTAALRRVQPAGPYQLVGFSFGGRLALEMARQLERGGERVALVAAIDTYLPGTWRPRPLRWLALHLRELSARGPDYATQKLRERLGLGPPPAASGVETTAEAVRARDESFRRRARLFYRPEPYTGKILLFRAEHVSVPLHYRLDPMRGWRNVARGPLEVHDLPCGHLEMLNPKYAAELARRLEPHLV